MRVQIDEAGRDQQTGGINLLAPVAFDPAGRDNPAIIDGNFADVAFAAAAIDDGAATDDKIKFGHGLSFHTSLTQVR